MEPSFTNCRHIIPFPFAPRSSTEYSTFIFSVTTIDHSNNKNFKLNYSNPSKENVEVVEVPKGFSFPSPEIFSSPVHFNFMVEFLEGLARHSYN